MDAIPDGGRGLLTDGLIDRLREPALDAAQETGIYGALASRVRPDARYFPLAVSHDRSVLAEEGGSNVGSSGIALWRSDRTSGRS